MISRSASILAFLSLALFVASCAEGGGAPLPVGDASLTGTGVCADGVLDPGEACECPPGATEPCLVPDSATESCAILSKPGDVGVVLCEPTMCMYLTTMCSAATGTAGTTAAGSGGGTGG